MRGAREGAGRASDMGSRALSTCSGQAGGRACLRKKGLTPAPPFFQPPAMDFNSASPAHLFFSRPPDRFFSLASPPRPQRLFSARPPCIFSALVSTRLFFLAPARPPFFPSRPPRIDPALAVFWSFFRPPARRARNDTVPTLFLAPARRALVAGEPSAAALSPPLRRRRIRRAPSSPFFPQTDGEGQIPANQHNCR